MNPSWRKNYMRYKSYFMNISQSYQERTDVKVYLEILLSLATIIIFSIFALRPTLLTIAKLIKEIETKKEILVRTDKKLQDVAAAQTIYDQNIDKILVLDSAIPSNPAVEIFTRQIEGLLVKNPVTLAGFSTGKGTILGAISTAGSSNDAPLPENAVGLPFSIGIATKPNDYPQIRQFLSDFELLRTPYKIDSLSIANAKDSQNESDVLMLVVGGRSPYLQKP